MPKVFRIGLPYSESALSKLARDWKLDWRESELQDPEQLAAVVLRALYAAFGLAENAILALKTVRSQSRNYRSTDTRCIQLYTLANMASVVFPTRRQA